MSENLLQLGGAPPAKPFGRVYMIVCHPNNKVYIGQTIQTVENRWYHHCRLSHLDKMMIERAINKYSPDAFSILTLGEAPDSQTLDVLEALFIAAFHSTDKTRGYNIREGGMSSRMSEETKKKLSLAHTGKKLSAEHRKSLCGRFGPLNNSYRHNVKTEDIVAMYADGKATRTIAKHFNIGATTVTRRLKKAGIALRPLGTNQFSRGMA